MPDNSNERTKPNGSRNGGLNYSLQAFPNIAKQACEAKARNSQDKTKVSLTSLTEVPVKQLPLWAEELRCIPNEIANSALFNAKNRRQARGYLKQAKIAAIGNAKITFTGEELRQDDETVWLQLIHIAKEHPLGNTVEFTPYALCKAIGWSIDGKSYTRLRVCLDRMQATSLSIYSPRLKEGVSLSMIPMFKWCDEAGAALTKYQVRIAPELVTLFGQIHYTRVEWSQRRALPVGVATWLHTYYASHALPFPVKIGTLKFGAGIETERKVDVRAGIERALIKLVEVGFLQSWEIVGELVHVKRKN